MPTSGYTLPNDLPDDIKIYVLIAAFCAYIMKVEGCTRNEALDRSAEMCSQAQIVFFEREPRAK
jgi:hypothetical protein